MENRIRELRNKKGLTQIDLASRLGIAQNTLSYWEQGTYEPDNKSLGKLANIFQCSVDYILCRTDSPHVEKGLTSEEMLNVLKFSEINPYIPLLKYGATSRFVIYGDEQSKFMKKVAEEDGIYFNAIRLVSINDLAEAFCAIFEKKVPPADHYITAHFEVVYTGLPHSILSVRKTDGEHSYVLVNANHYPRPETDEEAAKMALGVIKPTSPLKMKDAKPIETGIAAEGGAKGTRSVADPAQLADHMDQAEKEDQ